MKIFARSNLLTKSSLLVAAALLASAAIAAPAKQESVDPHANETKAQRDARMHWWREARFGMFIHWGLYSVPAGVYKDEKTNGAGEWIQHDLKIPVDYYADYAKRFDPEKFNADEWVSYAKAAGMKYIVMTAKHHEGFAMYPTKVDDWSIGGRTVFKRDPIGEMSAACKKAGIKFGVYYSQNLDWHHVGGGTAGPAWDDKQKGDFHAYIRDISAPQVKELLTTYKPAVLWWDINAVLTPDEVRALTAAFPADPALIANNRLGGGVPGDTETPEQYIPATGFKGRDWETCMTMNDTWGYKSTDHNFKSTNNLLHNLIDIASKGGNYLLNVGPTSEGLIPGPEVDRLKEMGEWMKTNGASIYATSASPYHKLPFDGRATVKANTLYLNVFSWPDTGLILPGLQTGVKSIKALATGQKLKFEKGADGSYSISKPDKIDPNSTAIAISLAGSPIVNEPEYFVTAGSSGEYKLTASEANTDGTGLQVEGGSEKNLGYWTNGSDAPGWKLKVASAGTFKVSLDFACPDDAPGSVYEIFVDGNASGVTGTVTPTGGWGTYQSVTLDKPLSLSAGTHTVQIRVGSMPHGAVMNLRDLIFTPGS